ncbi:unnamed protein product [Schistosoma bovis]|nr:unnamed protein product [Schistosoma bovis]
MQNIDLGNIPCMKWHSLVSVFKPNPVLWNYNYLDGTINRSRSCEEVPLNTDFGQSNYTNLQGSKNLSGPQGKFGGFGSHYEIYTSKSLNDILDYQMHSGNKTHTLHRHKSSSGLLLNDNFSSNASSSESLNDVNYENGHSDEENLPGARKRHGLREVTDNSDDVSGKSVSLVHSCSDFNSYWSENEEGHDVRNSDDSAVNSVLDGVTKLHVNEKENNSLPQEGTDAADIDFDVDADQDKTNPAYIPRGGRYYMHDHRTLEEDVVVVKKRESNRRWQHDKFNYYDQAPRSTEEIIWRYGYDIRKENICPLANKSDPNDGSNVPTTTSTPCETNETYHSSHQPSQVTSTKVRNSVLCGNESQKRSARTQGKTITYSSIKYNGYSRFTKSDCHGRNFSTRKDSVTDEFQTQASSRPIKEDSLSGTNVHRSHPTLTLDMKPAYSTNTHDSYCKHQQGLNHSYYTSNSNLSRRNREDSSKPPVSNYQYVSKKQAINFAPVNTKIRRVYKPQVIKHSSHIREQVKRGERVPKRYSAVRQNVSNIDSSTDKKTPLRLPSPVHTEESCGSVDVKDLVVTKLGTPGNVDEVTQLHKSAADCKDVIATQDQVCTKITGINTFSQQKANPQPVSISVHPVSLTHFQPSIEYSRRIPTEYSSVNPHLQTIYCPDIFQHDPRYQPPSTVMSNYVLPNAHQAQIHRLYGNGIHNMNLPVPVATTLCFDHVPCGVTNDPSQTYVMHLGMTAVEPHWNSEEKPVFNRRFPKKPLEVIDPRDGTRVNKVALSETQ